jgi:1-acyl-sn-glycerol-3-phosphate acyltransferase
VARMRGPRDKQLNYLVHSQHSLIVGGGMKGSDLRVLRLITFWISVAVLTISYSLLLPAILLSRQTVLSVVKSYLVAVLWLLRWIGGLKWEIRGGVGNTTGSVLVAAKHQSAFETLLLQLVLDNPAIILKKELLSVPLVGWVLHRLGHIGVDRSGELESARRLLQAARQAKEQGRPVVIFPEGSRRAVGVPADYRPGVDLLYAMLKVPCIPVAVNSGTLWPKGSLLPRPGTIVVEFLPPIPPELPRAVFSRRLVQDIENATARLLAASPTGVRNASPSWSGKDV